MLPVLEYNKECYTICCILVLTFSTQHYIDKIHLFDVNSYHSFIFTGCTLFHFKNKPQYKHFLLMDISWRFCKQRQVAEQARTGLLETMCWGPSGKAAEGMRVLLSVSWRAVDRGPTESTLGLWKRVLRPVGFQASSLRKQQALPWSGCRIAAEPQSCSLTISGQERTHPSFPW